MISTKHQPLALSATELDDYLERGWYRIGSHLVTMRYVVTEDGLSSTVWSRLNLHGYRFRRSLQRLMQRNSTRLQVQTGPLVIDAEREALYARYLEHVGGARAETLHEVLGHGPRRRIFNTHEVRVYDSGRLVAFSWFDLGRRSIQSLLGVYDPDYAKLSLGFYTMLLEIEFALARGFAFHYSGYVLSDHPCMDYKRRVGPLEYLEPISMRWQTEFPYPAHRSPARLMLRHLCDVRDRLERVGFSTRLTFNNAARVSVMSESFPAHLAAPLLLHGSPNHAGETLVITWEPETGFELHRCSLVRASVGAMTGAPPADEDHIDLLLAPERLADACDVAAIVHRLQQQSAPGALSPKR